MTTIGITGATGALGTLVLDDLLARGVAATDLVALVRDRTKAADRSEAGIDVREANYDDAAGWPSALEGIQTLLLISASEPGKRGAAARGRDPRGPKRPASDTSSTPACCVRTRLRMRSLPSTRRTEELLAASSLDVTAAERNGWYTENYTGQLAQYLETGSIVDATAGATINAATRADFAARHPAQCSPATPGTRARPNELGGTGFTLADPRRSHHRRHGHNGDRAIGDRRRA